MSRSYRRPFAGVTGKRSAKWDKQIAHRCERRYHRYALAQCQDFEDFTPPQRRECAHNNVYDWSRDGRQRYQVPDARDWSRYCLAFLEGSRSYPPDKHDVWPPDWYTSLSRK